jgi:hypothetical protein
MHGLENYISAFSASITVKKTRITTVAGPERKTETLDYDWWPTHAECATEVSDVRSAELHIEARTLIIYSPISANISRLSAFNVLCDDCTLILSSFDEPQPLQKEGRYIFNDLIQFPMQAPQNNDTNDKCAFTSQHATDLLRIIY